MRRNFCCVEWLDLRVSVKMYKLTFFFILILTLALRTYYCTVFIFVQAKRLHDIFREPFLVAKKQRASAVDWAFAPVIIINEVYLSQESACLRCEMVWERWECLCSCQDVKFDALVMCWRDTIQRGLIVQYKLWYKYWYTKNLRYMQVCATLPMKTTIWCRLYRCGCLNAVFMCD